MASVHLIRHGQASFAKADYDELSQLGERQSRMLGEHLRRTARGRSFIIISGEMRRHRQTAAAMIEGLGGSHEISFDAGWNEVDHTAILEALRPDLGDYKAVKSWIMAQPKSHEIFQQVFAAAMARWVSGKHDEDYKESRRAFLARVETSLNAACQRAGDDVQVLVVTSCVAIVSVVKLLLGVSEPVCRALENIVTNASLSTLLREGDDLSLFQFNNATHLETPDGGLITRR